MEQRVVWVVQSRFVFRDAWDKPKTFWLVDANKGFFLSLAEAEQVCGEDQQAFALVREGVSHDQ